MENNLQESIYEKEGQIDELKTKSDEIYKQFIKDTVVSLTSWYNERVTNYIGANPDKINNKSDAQIDKLHKQVSIFTDSFEKLFSESLDKVEKPWHKRSIDELISNVLDDNVLDDKKIVDQALSLFLQKPIEKSYSLNHDTFDFISSRDRIVWSSEMITSMEIYQKLYRQAEPLFKELKSLKEQQDQKTAIEKKNMAKAKWEKASKK